MNYSVAQDNGGHPGHDHPVDRRDPPGGPGGPGRGLALIASVCTGHDYSQPGKPRIDWDDPAAKDALVSALVNDANALVAALTTRELDEQAASAVALLALVAGQDVEPAEDSDGTDGRWRIARKVAGDRVISSMTLRHGTPASHPRPDGTGTGRTWPPSPPPAWSPMSS